MTRLEEKNHNTKEYYNRVFLDRFDRTGLDYSDSWRVEALLSDYLGGKLLDIGCGVCPLVNKAKGMYNDEVWGVDFADELIERLKVYYPEIDYATCDFNSLIFKDEYFDYAILGRGYRTLRRPKGTYHRSIESAKKRRCTFNICTIRRNNGKPRIPTAHLVYIKRRYGTITP
jgi:ubiquinone/menaquinone biosynthesis C-methylase UbiE